MGLKVSDVRAVDFGWFVRPGEEVPSGRPRVEAVLGYVVDHPRGVLLFDTGMVTGHAGVDAHYQPTHRHLDEALAGAGVHRRDIQFVANCHLHMDHCGDNPAFAGRPVYVQAVELERARAVEGYTLPRLVDHERVAYERLEGDAEILPGVWVLPTPGHTEGHQSLVVRCDDGTVVLAGQSHDTATDFSADVLSWRARQAGSPAAEPLRPWIDTVAVLDPSRVCFAHDHAVWARMP